MLNVEIEKRLKEIFSLVLDLDENDIGDDLSTANTPSWDSLALVSIVSAMESEFNVSIANQEALQMKSFKSAKELLAGKHSLQN